MWPLEQNPFMQISAKHVSKKKLGVSCEMKNFHMPECAKVEANTAKN